MVFFVARPFLEQTFKICSPVWLLCNPAVCFQVAKAVSHSLKNCVNCLPGQKDVDLALKSIGEASKKLLIETVSFLYDSPAKMTSAVIL